MLLFGDRSADVGDPFFARALTLAELGRPTTTPNPLVGAVVVHEGRIVGEGYHQLAGGPHAEVLALSAAGTASRGADLYVTLEPCSHHGRTPPCVDAIIEAGVSRVWIGMADPNPAASGGADRLRAAGIEVAFSSDATPFQDLNRAWLTRLEKGLPHVTVKLALSLDGHPGFAPGTRSAITGPSGALVTAALRRRSDAVMVGAATVIADDPLLTVRATDGLPDQRQPLRVVVCRDRIPSPDSKLFTDDAGPVLLVVPAGRGDSAAEGFPQSVSVVENPDGASLAGALQVLAGMDVVDLLVEAGPTLFIALCYEGLIDLLVTVHAGGFTGSSAPDLYLQPARADSRELVPLFRPVESGIVGDVVATTWEPRHGNYGSEGKAG